MERFAMNEFKPLSFEEKKYRLESKRDELMNKRQPLISKKQEIEGRLSVISNKIRTGGLIENGEYAAICREQNDLNQQKLSIERELAEFKVKLREVNKEIDGTILQKKRIPDEQAKISLFELKDKYVGFAADPTRVSSMRAMAAKFAEEIQIILKQMP